MSHVYQPVMLRQLLLGGGEATVDQIAKALLSHDRSQVEYYEHRTKIMVGKVLTDNGVVEPVKDGNRTVGYRLKDFVGVDETDKDRLILECEQKITDYIEKRGSSISSISQRRVRRRTFRLKKQPKAPNHEFRHRIQNTPSDLTQ